jgi:hypothetical protein
MLIMFFIEEKLSLLSKSTFRNDNGVSHGGQRSVPIGSPKGARFVSCLGKTEVFVMRGYCSHVCVSSTSAKIIHVSTHTLYLPALPVTGAASKRAHCMRPITSAPVNSLLILRSGEYYIQRRGTTRDSQMYIAFILCSFADGPFLQVFATNGANDFP